MKPRTALILTAVAGLAAAVRAQEFVVVSYTWAEVVAGTTTPVLSPNSALEPGEGAYIRLNLFASINGTSAIGQTTTYTPPPPPGAGTVRGIASMAIRLDGNNGASSASGSWSDRVINPRLSNGAWPGTVQNGGASLNAILGGQFVTPGQTADATNPIDDAFSGVWTPTSYLNRSVTFRLSPSVYTPIGQCLGVLVQYGTAYIDPSDPTTAYAQYLTKYIAGDFGNGLTIPVVPTPPTGAAWLSAGLLAASRKRRPP